ncbi:MAG: LysR family transcriptional regulator [Oscillospiraceae bacterium]
MTLQQLKYVLTVADAGSMSQAAEQLYISQPTLSSAVKDLEKETGISIFQRTSKGVFPTSEGADFLSYARQVYQQYDLLTQKYSAQGSVRRKFGVSSQHYSFAVKAFVETVKKYDTLNFDFAMRETRTMDVITDVGMMKSEVGILYLDSFNRRVIEKLLSDNELTFTPLIRCRAYVYIWKGHPLAGEKSLSLEQLRDYPCMSFEQGEQGSGFLAEEILSDKDYPRIIRSTDRATQLNLMLGLNGYTLCSGIICEELNGSDFTAIPFREDETNRNSDMEIGYIVKNRCMLSDIAQTYIAEVKKYLSTVRSE